MKPKSMKDFIVGNEYQYKTITDTKLFSAALYGYGPQLPGTHLVTIVFTEYHEHGSTEKIASFVMIGREEKDLVFRCSFNSFRVEDPKTTPAKITIDPDISGEK